MALVRVTLTSAITASQLTFGVSTTNNAAFPAPGSAPVGYQPIRIGGEMAFLVSCPIANVVTVRMRGSDGSAAVAHDIGESVVTSALPSDFPAIAAGEFTTWPLDAPIPVTYGQSGAIAVPTAFSSMMFLAGTSALAMTLGPPSLALNGQEITITSQTAAAHVITATGLFYTGLSGPYTTATFPASSGASMNLVAQNGAWNVSNASITPVVFT